MEGKKLFHEPENQFPLAGIWRICLRIRFYKTKKLLTLVEISEKSKKIVANSSDKSFK